jgi:hypothetical protein
MQLLRVCSRRLLLGALAAQQDLYSERRCCIRGVSTWLHLLVRQTLGRLRVLGQMSVYFTSSLAVWCLQQGLR